MPDTPSHARVVLTVRTKLTGPAAKVVARIATRLAATPGFRDDPETAICADVGARLGGSPEHVVAAAELAVLASAAANVGDLNDLEQMRLQMAIDRRSKQLEGLGNALKKSSDTSDAVLANLK
jgi:hypothetical protein